MNHDLSTRNNGDAPPPVIAHEEEKLTEVQRDDEARREGEAQQQDADAAIAQPQDSLADQFVQPDPDSADAHLDTQDVDLPHTPGAEPGAAERITTAEQARGEQVYQERLPSNVATPAATTILSESTVSDMRSRWHAVQLRFVDDPAAVTGEMRAMVGEAVQTLSAALTDRQRELDSWSRSGGHDTEQLRVAVQRYRDFYELLLGH